VSVSFDPIEVDSELIRENAKQPQAELGLRLRHRRTAGRRGTLGVDPSSTTPAWRQ
jgi:hypothetical protein